MGPFQEYEEKKSPEKGSPRSRIPRLVLHPFRPKDKGSPLSDSPFSEEEGKECDMSSDHSKRTISTNSFCSDDTGCPTSQSVSPSKTPSGSEQSAHGSPTLPERKTKVKRVRVMAEWSGEPRSVQRHKRELRSAMKARGSEADFSSSSSTGSLKTRESLISNSAGKRAPSRSRSTHIRPLPVFKPAGSPTANRDAELYAPYRTPPRAAYSTNSSSCNSSPTSRRANLGRYHSCGDNHGIRPPNPEQYLTPLQQKEVAIRHLKIKLMESENRVHDRETEIEELKAQLCRMREDWIEEECHRVEAQLSLKEARKEIKQLRQVVETMKSSLMEKDKGIQKYFIDINIQNRKLESLLQSMELAQSGANLQDENTLDFICDSPDSGGKKMVGEEEGGMELGDQGAEAMADSGLLVNDEMANRADILEQVFMSTAVDLSQDSSGKLRAEAESGPGVSALSEEEQLIDKSTASTPALPNAVSTTISSSTPSQQTTEDKGIQTDTMPMSPDLQALLLQLLKFHGATAADTALSSSSGLLSLPNLPTSASTTATFPDSAPPSPRMPSPVHPESPDTSTDSGMCSSEPAQSRRFMEELDFGVADEEICLSPGLDVVGKRYWSNSFLVDLVAVAAPVLPTVAWLYSRHGVDGSYPVYNIAALIRGCCIMGLQSLRHVTHRPDA
ncbi:syntabulin isoform X1 [Seriola lalandi dorsalis]|uniref:Syntabulin (syntaxin-interacting) n=1 Tax=Seriola lalandi dorsalis TaxID=1841481 RepID=A0A3B4XEK7_SERLL|nr:syntabulin isoform X1 [Seriola lalandi dorsalis]XP_056237714.1 syntabulin isoform X1 [Seriola aureovittata]